MKQVKSKLNFHRTTRRYIPEDRILHNDRCENLQDTYSLCVPTYFIIEPAGEFEQTIEVKLNSPNNF
jgi:hypothetical protein